MTTCWIDSTGYHQDTLLFTAHSQICFPICHSVYLTFWTEILKPEVVKIQIRMQVARNLIIHLHIWLLCGFIKHLSVFHGQTSKVTWKSQLDSPKLFFLCLCRNTYDTVGHCSYLGGWGEDTRLLFMWNNKPCSIQYAVLSLGPTTSYL